MGALMNNVRVLVNLNPRIYLMRVCCSASLCHVARVLHAQCVLSPDSTLWCIVFPCHCHYNNFCNCDSSAVLSMPCAVCLQYLTLLLGHPLPNSTRMRFQRLDRGSFSKLEGTCKLYIIFHAAGLLYIIKTCDLQE